MVGHIFLDFPADPDAVMFSGSNDVVAVVCQRDNPWLKKTQTLGPDSSENINMNPMTQAESWTKIEPGAGLVMVSLSRCY